MFNGFKRKESESKQREVLDVIGHELRTPLSIVKVSFDLLKGKLQETSSQEDLSKYFERIDEAVLRAERILESAISSAKIEEGRLELHLEEVDLIPIIRNSIFVVEKEVKEKDLELQLRLPEEATVYADRVRVQEIMDNFLTNAVKYTNKGTIEISLSQSEGEWTVEVKDSGIGMSEESLKLLGEKFFRVVQEEKDDNLVKPGGTGLGLYISFKLISLMGGSFEVESELKKGSIFKFSLPIYRGQKEMSQENNEQKDLFKRMGFTQKAS